MLSAAAAAVGTEGDIYVGITGPSLLKQKSNKRLLEPIDDRKHSVVTFLSQCNPHVNVHVSVLEEGVQPLAATMPEMDSIVCSHESRAPCEAMNQSRVAQE